MPTEGKCSSMGLKSMPAPQRVAFSDVSDGLLPYASSTLENPDGDLGSESDEISEYVPDGSMLERSGARYALDHDPWKSTLGCGAQWMPTRGTGLLAKSLYLSYLPDIETDKVSARASPRSKGM